VITAFHVLLALWMFALGAVVGSFLNVCIYRIPWQKSVIWPGSHCPRCLRPIAARDNIPVVSWLALRGECRTCGAPIAARYALVEAFVGLLFVAVFVADVVVGGKAIYGDTGPYLRMAYHLALVCLLVAATFIDYDLQLIPDEITVPGMLVGVLFGAIAPDVRPDPSAAATWWEGLKMGLVGLVVGGGLTWLFRAVFSLALRREAMGFGDVTLMATIGAFLGWQGAVLTFFLAPFFGLAHAGWKVLKYVKKLLRRAKTSSVDRELPFGPYLSMAAVTLTLAWPWLWSAWGRGFFDTLAVVFWFLLGADTPPDPTGPLAGGR
jgi:leader peptidase (prepilin peptidase)/N-methyltransferase